MYSPKEKATVAAAAHGAFQRSHYNQDSSTKVLSMQGQINESDNNSLFLMFSLGSTGDLNTKGGEPQSRPSLHPGGSSPPGLHRCMVMGLRG